MNTSNNWKTGYLIIKKKILFQSGMWKNNCLSSINSPSWSAVEQNSLYFADIVADVYASVP